MMETEVTLPELGLIAVTRGMLGAGLGLLLADRLTPEQRKAAGWTLVLVGMVTTIPLAAEVLNSSRRKMVAGQSQESTRAMDQRRSEVGQFARPQESPRIGKLLCCISICAQFHARAGGARHELAGLVLHAAFEVTHA